MATSQYDRLFELLDSIAKETLPKGKLDSIKKLAKTKKHLAGIEFENVLGGLLDLAFTQEPESFHDIKWVNSSLGTPIWVRPGETWDADTDAPEAQDFGSFLESRGASVVTTNRRSLSNSDVVRDLIRRQEEETEEDKELFINYWEP